MYSENIGRYLTTITGVSWFRRSLIIADCNYCNAWSQIKMWSPTGLHRRSFSVYICFRSAEVLANIIFLKMTTNLLFSLSTKDFQSTKSLVSCFEQIKHWKSVNVLQNSEASPCLNERSIHVNYVYGLYGQLKFCFSPALPQYFDLIVRWLMAKKILHQPAEYCRIGERLWLSSLHDFSVLRWKRGVP